MKNIDIPYNFKPRPYQLNMYNCLEMGYRRGVFIWNRRCLHEDSHIIMGDGSWKYIKDIKKGDKILSWDGKQYVPDRVKDIWEVGERKGYDVKVKSGKSFSASIDHKYLTSRQGSKVRWEKLEDIKAPRRLYTYSSYNTGVIHDPELAELIGYLISDGSVHQEQSPKFTNTDKRLIDRVAYLTKRYFGYEGKYHTKGNGWDLILSNGTRGGGKTPNKVKEFFRDNNALYKKSKRRVPKILWNMDNASLVAFFGALIDCDGNIYNQKKVRYMGNKTVAKTSEIKIFAGESKLLMWDYYWLLRKIGIISGQCQKDNRENYNCYIIRIWTNEFVYKLLSKIKTIGKEDARNLGLALTKNHFKKRVKFKGDSYCYSITNKTKNSFNAYDLETANNQCFIADGYIVHNSGKDKTALNVMVREAITKIGTYYYFFPNYNQGRKILWDGIDKDGFKFMSHIPPEIVRGRPNNTEMKVTLKNNSIMQIIGTDDIDRIVGTNPIGCVFSEYALQNPNAFEYIRPILAENNGWALFPYCVDKDTLIISDNGLERIGKNIPHGFSPVDKKIYGIDNKFHNATEYYNGGEQETISIITKRGYEISCTPIHPLWDGEKWKESKKWRVGDKIPIQRNQQVWGDNTDISEWERPKLGKGYRKPKFIYKLSNRLMYLLGLIVAEGYWTKHTVTITTLDKRELDDFLKRFGFIKRDYCHYTFSSVDLVSFIEWFGIKKGAKNKNIPDRLYSLPKDYIASFIRGYFDGDGSSHKKRCKIHCDSVSEKLIKDLQILLLNFGIISTRRFSITKKTKKVKVDSEVWRLEFDGYNTHLFYKQIRFKLERKQKNYKTVPDRQKEWYCDCVDVDRKLLNEFIKGMDAADLKRHTKVSYRTLKKLLNKKYHPAIKKIVDDNYYYDEIKEIKQSVSHVYDFVIPDTHSFFSNGFISHNTPRGHNQGYILYNMALKNPDWMCELLTVDDTKSVTPEEIQAERDSGMPEEMINQEFFCNFEASMTMQFIPFDIVMNAVRREYDIRAYQYAPIIIGVDVARFGDCKTVLYVRQGIETLEIIKKKDLDLMQTASLVADVQDRYFARKVFVDGVGMGAGVVDRLRSLGREVEDVQSGAAADKDRYYNKRTEMWQKMKEWLQGGGSIPNDPELIADITSPEYSYDGIEEKVKLEKKEDMKKRGLSSPDTADALAYTFYMPVSPNLMEDEYDYEDVNRMRKKPKPAYVTGY